MGYLRRLGFVAAIWTVVMLSSALSQFLRDASGELSLRSGWYWIPAGAILLWTAVTPPILALSRRLPIERRTWPAAVLAHLAMLLVVLVLDGLVGVAIGDWLVGHRWTFWQEMWRYSFIDAFFYAGVVAVEHAARYYRMYRDRRVRASELEAQLSRAQLQALQMQIRPHFLFNTLNTISGLVRVDDKASAITMLAGLGDLLRLLLRSDGAQEVPVRQEVELIERYLQIEQVRFGDQLEVEISVEPGVEDALVPNLILQPLVENAVRHGVGAATGRVAVTVRRIDRRKPSAGGGDPDGLAGGAGDLPRGIDRRKPSAGGGDPDGLAGGAGELPRGIDSALRMEVFDSGDAQPRDGDRLGIGLSNTRARLERLYGGVHRFELAQTAAGTQAIIEIPLHHQPRLPS